MPATRFTRPVVTDNSFLLAFAGHANDTVQSGLFAGIFAAFAQAMAGPAKYFVLPTALITEMARAIIAILRFYNASNRNFTKTTLAMLETSKAVVIGAAVLGSLFGVVSLVAAAPFLFVAALGANVAFSAVKSLFHGFKWSTAKGKYGKEHHKKELGQSLVAVVIGAISIGAIALLLIVSPPVTIVTAIVAYTASVILGASALMSGWQALSAYRNSTAVHQVPEHAPVEHSNTIQPLRKQHSRISLVEELVRPHYIHADRLQADIGDLYNETFNNDSTSPQLTTRQILLELIEYKLPTLQQEIDSQSFFQSKKRETKREFLTCLKSIISGHQGELIDHHGKSFFDTPAQLLQHAKDTNQLNYLYQSFFKDKGDVEKIFLLADGYFKRYSPKVTALPSEVCRLPTFKSC